MGGGGSKDPIDRSAEIMAEMSAELARRQAQEIERWRQLEFERQRGMREQRSMHTQMLLDQMDQMRAAKFEFDHVRQLLEPKPVLQLRAQHADTGRFIVEASNLGGNVVAKALVEEDATLGSLRASLGIGVGSLWKRTVLVSNDEVLDGTDELPLQGTRLLQGLDVAHAKVPLYLLPEAKTAVQTSPTGSSFSTMILGFLGKSPITTTSTKHETITEAERQMEEEAQKEMEAARKTMEEDLQKAQEKFITELPELYTEELHQLYLRLTGKASTV